jgi:hypothetical protein
MRRACTYCGVGANHDPVVAIIPGSLSDVMTDCNLSQYQVVRQIGSVKSKKGGRWCCSVSAVGLRVWLWNETRRHHERTPPPGRTPEHTIRCRRAKVWQGEGGIVLQYFTVRNNNINTSICEASLPTEVQYQLLSRPEKVWKVTPSHVARMVPGRAVEWPQVTLAGGAQPLANSS